MRKALLANLRVRHSPIYSLTTKTRRFVHTTPKMDITPAGSQYFDTHIHIDYLLQKVNKSLTDLDEFVENEFAKPANGTWAGSVQICCEEASYEPTLKIMKHPKIHAAFGIHPHNAKDYNDEIEGKFSAIMADPKTVAWGEIGLDYHYMNSPADVQQEMFVRQMKMAVKHNKPLVIHTREAEDDTIRLMTETLPQEWKVHVHCFTSSLDLAKKLVEHFPNLCIGFTGVVTFKTAQDIRDVIDWLPLDRILLETDGPFMAPIPFRGKAATSGMVPHVAAKIAEVKKVSISEVYAAARENTKKIYGI